jgi:hypothetical protein
VLSVPKTYNLLLAGGRGGGKSTAMLLLVLRTVEEEGEHAKILIVRESHKAVLELEQNLLGMFSAAFPKGFTHNRAEHVFRFKSGALVELGEVSDVRSVSRWQGRNFNTICADEFGLFANRKWFGALTTNLRAEEGVPLRIILTANPGGPQHAYLHQNFIARERPWRPFDVNGETFVVCPSVMTDNPYLNHADYERRLRSACGGDDALLRAFLWGDWNIARGAFFAGTLDEKVHMLSAAWAHPITREWRPFLAHDYGASSPSVTFLALKAPGDVGGFPRNSLILLDELATVDAQDPNLGLNWPVSKLCEAVVEMCDKWNVRSPEGVADDAMGLHGETLISIMGEHGVSLHRPKKGRVAGWATMRQLLHNAKEQNGKPGMWITARCKYFWQTVPFVQRDDTRPEDILTTGPDHAADAARYAAMELAESINLFNNTGTGPKHFHPLVGLVGGYGPDQHYRNESVAGRI